MYVGKRAPHQTANRIYGQETGGQGSRDGWPNRGHLVARAASFLLLTDSRASFEIEGERPPRNRLERWGRAVLQAGKNKLTVDEMVRLQGVLIVRVEKIHGWDAESPRIG